MYPVLFLTPIAPPANPLIFKIVLPVCLRNKTGNLSSSQAIIGFLSKQISAPVSSGATFAFSPFLFPAADRVEWSCLVSLHIWRTNSRNHKPKQIRFCSVLCRRSNFIVCIAATKRTTGSVQNSCYEGKISWTWGTVIWNSCNVGVY
jgi:hypothetical protein